MTANVHVVEHELRHATIHVDGGEEYLTLGNLFNLMTRMVVSSITVSQSFTASRECTSRHCRVRIAVAAAAVVATAVSATVVGKCSTMCRVFSLPSRVCSTHRCLRTLTFCVLLPFLRRTPFASISSLLPDAPPAPLLLSPIFLAPLALSFLLHAPL